MNSMYGGKGAAPTGATGQSTGNFPASVQGKHNFYKEKTPRGYGRVSMQNFSPEQLGLFQQLFGNLGPDSFTNRLAQGDQGTFDEIEAPALRQFNELQGGLASRFSGMGTMGSRRSSGFQNASSQAASNFAQQLQSQRQGLQRQALSDLFAHSNTLLGQRPVEKAIAQKGPSNFEKGLDFTLRAAEVASKFGNGDASAAAGAA
jgi:hypothetical protein